MKRKKKLTRLQVAEGAFRIAANEHIAWGQRMVHARTELLEANAEERAKLALQYPDDKLIQSESAKSTKELLDWYKKINAVAINLSKETSRGRKFPYETEPTTD